MNLHHQRKVDYIFVANLQFGHTFKVLYFSFQGFYVPLSLGLPVFFNLQGR